MNQRGSGAPQTLCPSKTIELGSGGYEGAMDRLVAGDLEAMEEAIYFIEPRPYFFRSGYMFDALLRKVKHAPLSLEQHARLQIVADGARP